MYPFSGNVAYKKKASQSGEESNWNSKKYPAGKAVDGTIDSILEHNSCAHPMEDERDINAWWMVDLGDTYKIYGVVIYNRASCE